MKYPHNNMITWNRLAVHICQISQLVLSTLLCSVSKLSQSRAQFPNITKYGYERIIVKGESINSYGGNQSP